MFILLKKDKINKCLFSVVHKFTSQSTLPEKDKIRLKGDIRKHSQFQNKSTMRKGYA